MTTFDPSAPPPVALYDTLLRDGSQMEGIAFSLQDKIAIAHRLDALGMHYVEGGFPGSNEKDRAFFEQMRSRPLARAKLVAFGGTRKPGAEVAEDFSVAALREAGTPVVTFVGKAIASQVESVLNTSREENLAIGSRWSTWRRWGGRCISTRSTFSTGSRRIRTTRCRCCGRRGGRGRST